MLLPGLIFPLLIWLPHLAFVPHLYPPPLSGAGDFLSFILLCLKPIHLVLMQPMEQVCPLGVELEDN